jgi:ribosomal-protein-alanine N-acetyltransferase
VIDIRRATPEDAAVLSRIHASSFDDGWSEADFATWLSRNEGFAILACEREREAIAFGLALAAGEDAELLSIAVAPGARQRGLGGRIFAALDIEAMNRHLKRWVLEVAHNNLAAIALYESSGFVEIGRRKDYYRQATGRADARVMSRPVGDPARQTPGGHGRA